MAKCIHTLQWQDAKNMGCRCHSDVSGIGSEENAVETDAACGTVCFVDKKSLIIKCGKDYLSVMKSSLRARRE